MHITARACTGYCEFNARGYKHHCRGCHAAISTLILLDGNGSDLALTVMQKPRRSNLIKLIEQSGYTICLTVSKCHEFPHKRSMSINEKIISLVVIEYPLCFTLKRLL